MQQQLGEMFPYLAFSHHVTRVSLPFQRIGPEMRTSGKQQPATRGGYVCEQEVNIGSGEP